MADINTIHELTMLYLSQQDLSQTSPGSLVDKYKFASDEIKKAFRETASKSTQQKARY